MWETEKCVYVCVGGRESEKKMCVLKCVCEKEKVRKKMCALAYV